MLFKLPVGRKISAQFVKEADRSEIQALDEGVGDVNQR